MEDGGWLDVRKTTNYKLVKLKLTAMMLNWLKKILNKIFSTLKEKILIEDGYIVFYISFLPNTGNKYFLAAIDDIVKLYDFETGQVVVVIIIVNFFGFFFLI